MREETLAELDDLLWDEGFRAGRKLGRREGAVAAALVAWAEAIQRTNAARNK